jgi:hypothetical protein
MIWSNLCFPRRPISPTNVTAAYASFPHISLREHTFYVASANREGNSRDVSRVRVPHHDQSKKF